jgi:hypothetical protein
MIPRQFDRFARLGDGIITTYLTESECRMVCERGEESLAEHGRALPNFPYFKKKGTVSPVTFQPHEPRSLAAAALRLYRVRLRTTAIAIEHWRGLWSSASPSPDRDSAAVKLLG